MAIHEHTAKTPLEIAAEVEVNQSTVTRMQRLSVFHLQERTDAAERRRWH